MSNINRVDEAVAILRIRGDKVEEATKAGDEGHVAAVDGATLTSHQLFEMAGMEPDETGVQTPSMHAQKEEVPRTIKVSSRDL